MDKKTISLFDIFRSSGSGRMKMIKLVDHAAGAFVAFILPSAPVLRKPLIKKILVIRPGGIGDAVFLLPVLRQLKELQVRVDILCEQRNAGVFISQEGLAEQVFCYDRWKDVPIVLAREYDAVIDTEQWHYLSAVFCRLVKALFRAGFATRPLRAKLFNAPVKYDQGPELENFRRLFEAVMEGFSNISLGLDGSFKVSAPAAAWAMAEMERKAPRPVILSLGGSIPERRLTAVQWMNIIRRLLSQGKAPVLIGGSDALSLSLELQKEAGGALSSYVGELTLERSAALVSCAEHFIGTDSGMLHIACAVGVPTTGIFGPGNAEKWAPRGKKHKLISLVLPCSPCTLFGYTIPTCQHKAPCMNNLLLKECL